MKEKIVFLSIVLIVTMSAIVCKISDTDVQVEEKQENLLTESVLEVNEVDVLKACTESESNSEEITCRVILNDEERDLLCRTVYCEAGNQSAETQEMVALTILNRLESDNFPDTLHEVIYQKNQYEVTTWSGFEDYGWTDQVEQSVENALMENNHPSDMYYFRSGYYHSFGVPYIQSGDLYFSTEGR